MTKYKQIQTYIKLINAENFFQILCNYKRVLLEIGFSIQDVKMWESKINWMVDDLGSVAIHSIPYSHEITLNFEEYQMNVAASIFIWSDSIDMYLLEEPWVEVVVKVNSQDTTNLLDNAQCEKFYFEIMSKFSEVFQETGVYVTNEMQDGEAFPGSVSRIEEKYWEFDYAIIPYHQNLLYDNVPMDFRSYSLQNGIGYAKRIL